MRPDIARQLNQLNGDFYQGQAASFSATRQGPWGGWGRCLDLAGITTGDGETNPHDASPPLRVLDVACGNLRLARFLATYTGGRPVSYLGIDNSTGLLRKAQPPAGWDVRLRQADLVGAQLGESDTDGRPTGTPPSSPLGLTPDERGGFGLVACFGFFHHVPTRDARRLLLRELLRACAPGGACCVSLWQFARDPARLARARRSTAEACRALGIDPSELDEGDFLLGWQGRPGVWRYCHSFDDAEGDNLVASTAEVATVLGDFFPDGGPDALNRYLVLRPR